MLANPNCLLNKKKNSWFLLSTLEKLVARVRFSLYPFGHQPAQSPNNPHRLLSYVYTDTVIYVYV